MEDADRAEKRSENQDTGQFRRQAGKNVADLLVLASDAEVFEGLGCDPG